jgi:peptidoglycan/LPS O-acetylase OafA/YrhL
MKGAQEIYFNQLNGIRFVAVFLVLMDHWLVPIMPFPTGHLGVVIFFVLSGFLITRILFESADQVGVFNVSPWKKLLRFVYRRSLRIFPIYYLVLILGLLFNVSNFKEIWPFLFSYTPNLYMMWKGSWLGVWDHLWSLAVEEQYYLVFPYFILFLSQKKYRYVFFSMLLIGLACRWYYFTNFSHAWIESNWLVSYVNPLGAIDCFGIGGILAYLFHYEKTRFLTLSKSYLPVLGSLILFILVLWASSTSNHLYDNIWFMVLERSFASLFAFFLIALAVAEKQSQWATFLTQSWVSYLGKISYGLYLYHNFIYNYYHTKGNTLWGYLTDHYSIFRLEFFNLAVPIFIINLIILILVASFSWFFIEKPINALKNKI